MPLVSDYMTQKPHVLQPQHEVYHAFATMELFRLRHVPIVDDKTGKLVGIVSDRDLKKHMHASFNPDADEFIGANMHTPLSSLMTADPVVTVADEELKHVVARMLDRKISAVVVIDEEHKPVGILTDTDMLQLLHTLL